MCSTGLLCAAATLNSPMTNVARRGCGPTGPVQLLAVASHFWAAAKEHALCLRASHTLPTLQYVVCSSSAAV